MSSGPAHVAMDVEEVVTTPKSVMASSGTVGSVSISLHPLVIMNISEHWTRIRAQEGAAHQGNANLCSILHIKLQLIF